ncbi:MAG: glycosyltransferase family 9 protein [Desulfobacterales bacterium]
MNRAKNFGEPGRVLAVSIGGLGDTILFSPVLRALRKSYPETYIELLVANRLAEEVYSCADLISSVTFLNLNRSSIILKSASLLSFILKARLNGGFSAGFFAAGLDSKIGSFLKYAGIVKHLAFAPAPQSCSTDLNCNLELARSINETALEYDVFVPIKNKFMLEAMNLLNEHSISLDKDVIVAIYPSVELIHRPRWELAKLIHVIQLLKNDGFNGKIVVVGSQHEGDEWEALDKENIADANLAGKLTILGSAALLSKCSLTIGNDGGLMHVAGAVGSPLVTMMANAPLSYRPPGENVKIIQSKLGCCDGKYPNRPKGCLVAKCTDAIKVQEVYEACIQRLSGLQN